MDCFLLVALRLSRGNKTDSFSTHSSYHTFCRVAYFGVLFTTLEEWIPSLVKSLMTWVIKLFVLQRLRSYWAKGDGKGLWALSLYWLLFDPHLTLHCCVYSAFAFHVLRNLRKKKKKERNQFCLILQPSWATFFSNILTEELSPSKTKLRCNNQHPDVLSIARSMFKQLKLWKQILWLIRKGLFSKIFDHTKNILFASYWTTIY